MSSVAQADEWFCVFLLVVLAVLTVMASGGDPFFAWTAGGSVLLAIAALRNSEARRDLIGLGFLLPASLVVAFATNRLVASACPHTLDRDLFYLGHGLSTAMYHWTLRHSFWWTTLNTVYSALPFFGAFVACVSPRRMPCARAWILAAIIAPFFYMMFPAVGPAHIGDPTAPRNCIPSLHMTWALLCAVYVAPRWRRAATVFTVLTAVATLGTGEHYLFDLAAAVPYTWGICRLEVQTGKWFAKCGARRSARKPALAGPRAIALEGTFPVDWNFALCAFARECGSRRIA